MKNPNLNNTGGTKDDPIHLAREIKNGDIFALSKGISLIESQNLNDLKTASQLLEAISKERQAAKVIGITGSPGAGKSTFIDHWGMHLINQGYKVAVLAIDPSSRISKGSILGDKTRMEQLSKADNAFIRPSAAGKTLGGIARKTRESIALCEAAAYDYIIIESVGVGQSETNLNLLVDVFCLLILPGSGDDLQGIKRGIVELADVICVNKSDGERKKLARDTKKYFKHALHYNLSHKEVPIILTSSEESIGFEAFTDVINNFYLNNNDILQKRSEKLQEWWNIELENTLIETLYSIPQVRNHLKQIEHQFIAVDSPKITQAILELRAFISNQFDNN